MITIVTAFFNINREDWKEFNRSSNYYLDSFSKWAHIKNRIIIYVESDKLKDEVISIRKSYGLEDQTEVYVINDIELLDVNIYENLKRIENSDIHRIWRLRNKNPEVCYASYNYVMYLKFWCLKDAVFRYSLTGQVSWMDFGFAHNGTVFPYQEDFDFVWDYDFGNKVTTFSIKPLDSRPVFDIINTMDTYIMGCIFIAPVELVNRLYDDIRSYLVDLIKLGYMDDDQILLLMAVREKTDYVQYFPSKWFLPIKEYGNNKMRVVNKKPDNRIKIALRSVKNTIYRIHYYAKLNEHLKSIEYK